MNMLNVMKSCNRTLTELKNTGGEHYLLNVNLVLWSLLVILSLLTSGCATSFKLSKAPELRLEKPINVTPERPVMLPVSISE